MKILALHGKQQNGEVFRSRLGRLPHKIQQLQQSSLSLSTASTMMMIDYVDAPFELPLKQGDAIAMRTWYLRRGGGDDGRSSNSSSSSVDHESIEQTLSYLETLWHSSSSKDSKGKYDGIIGFSQGGMIAAIVASLPHRFPGLQFAIIGGAPDLSCLDDTIYSSSSSSGDNGIATSQYSSQYTRRIDVSSLHLIGQKDQVVAPSSSYALANRFRDPRIVEHEMGHCIPTQAKYLSMIVDFIREAGSIETACSAQRPPSIGNISFSSKHAPTLSPANSATAHANTTHHHHHNSRCCDSDEIATAQAEEYEVLSSIYPSEITILTATPPVLAGDACISLHVQLRFTTTTTTTLMDTSKIPSAWLDNIGIDVSCPSDYPTQSPPIITITTGALSMFDGFSSSMALSLTQCIYKSIGVEYNEGRGGGGGGRYDDAIRYIGEPCIMVCIQTAYEWFDDQRWLSTGNAVSSSSSIINNTAKMSHCSGAPPPGDIDGDNVDRDDDDDDVNEALEKEMIATATLEACRAAYQHRLLLLSQRGFDDDISSSSSSHHPHASDPPPTSASADRLGPYSNTTSTTATTAADADVLSSSSLPTSARGVWNYTVGLVGKPSAGKSTFYNAVTRAVLERNGRLMAEVAPHPFTTIEPNIGPGWYASFHNEEEEEDISKVGKEGGDGLTRQPLHGRVSDLSAGLLDLYLTNTTTNNNNNNNNNNRYGIDKEKGSNAATAIAAMHRHHHHYHHHRTGLEGRRLLPVCVKDVAGLVPGAYKGRGKGNRFLSDLCDADVLVHVVDVTGQADRDGNAVMHHPHHHRVSIGNSRCGSSSSRGNSDIQAHDDDDNAVAPTAERGSNPIEDAEWIREELHRWIHGNIRAKWDSVVSKKKNKNNKHHQHNAHQHEQCAQRVYQLFTGYQGPKWCLEVAARRASLVLKNADQWSALDLHRIVAHFLCVRFPICLALNKIDMLDDSRDGMMMSVIDQCREAARARGEVAVPVSSRAECCLLKKKRMMMLAAAAATATTATDTTAVMIASRDQLMIQQQNDDVDATTQSDEEENILLDVMNRFGSTGVLEAISAAVRLRPPVLCYPVHDLDSEYPVGYSTGKTISNTIIHPTNTSSSNPASSSSSSSSSSSPIPRLLDCIQFKPGSTVGDVYEALKRPGVLSHTVLLGEFVRSEGRSIHRDSPKQQLRRDSVLDDRSCVLRIQTNRKSVWQSSSSSQSLSSSSSSSSSSSLSTRTATVAAAVS